MNKIVRMKPTESHGYKYKYKILVKESTILSENEKIYYSKLMGIRWFCSILETSILYWSISLTVVLHLNRMEKCSSQMNMNVFKLKINQVCEIEQSICKSQLNLQMIKRPKNQWKNKEKKNVSNSNRNIFGFWQLHHLQIYVYSYR